MSTIYNHNVSPPAAINRLATGCTWIAGASVPAGHPLPAGVYPDGGSDPATVPAGYREIGSAREVRNGLSVNVLVLEAKTLEEVQVEKTAEIQAECDARLESRWPTSEQFASLAGVPVDPESPEFVTDVAEHMTARLNAILAVGQATTVEDVLAVTVGWPE